MGSNLLLISIFLLIANAAFGIVLAVFIFRNPLTPLSRTMVFFILGASLWSTGYALELISPGLPVKVLWAKVQYIGITILPVAWLVYAFQYMGSPGWLENPLRDRLWLLAVPILTLCLVWTNELHGLIWQNMRLERTGPIYLMAADYGPGFWVFLAFSYILILTGSIKLIGGLFGTFRLHRFQASLALLASIFPWLGNMVYLSDQNPIPHVDWTPFSFTIAGLLFTISLFRFNLINILPLAQKTVFARLPDPLVVLDSQNRITDMNPAAEKIIGSAGKSRYGKPVEQVFPVFGEVVSQAGGQNEFRVEISMGSESDLRFYEVRVLALPALYQRIIGRLIICHDITPHKKAQSLLEQARNHLEEIVADRTAELSWTVERLQEELNQRVTAEKRFADLVNSAPDAMVLVDEDGCIVVVNAQVERLFGYARDELVGRNIDVIITTPWQAAMAGDLEKILANPVIPHSFRLRLTARRKNGRRMPVEISVGTLATKDCLWLACSLRDISERIKTEQAQNKLVAELRQSHKQLRAIASRLQEVQELERRQIASELHDCVGQNLTALHLNLKLVQNQVMCEPDLHIQTRIADSLKLIEETNRMVREVMAELHPPVLDEFGLAAALHWYTSLYSERTGITTRLIGDEFKPRLSPEQEILLFRIVQEALVNAAKHAQAKQVMVFMESVGETASIIVEDDGVGFDPNAPGAADDRLHWGIANMHQRAASIGAQLTFHSNPGQGTLITIRFRRNS